MVRTIICVAVGAILIYLMSYRVRSRRRLKHNDAYIKLYEATIQGVPDTYKLIEKYLEKEKDPEFINKAYLLKLYFDISKANAYKNTMALLDFEPIFYKNGKYSHMKVRYNSDSFLWVIVLFAKARRYSMFDVSETVYNKLNLYYANLRNQIDIHVVNAAYDALNDTSGDGIQFFKNLLSGLYPRDVSYDKSMIGVYKRVGAAVLAYNGEILEDFEIHDLKVFAQTYLGHVLLSELGIYEDYKPNEYGLVDDEPLLNEEEEEETDSQE